MNDKELEIKNSFNNLLKATTDEEKMGILYAITAGEFKIMFEEIANDFIENADSALINAHYVYDFCIYETIGFFMDVIEQNCIDESRMDYFKQVREKCFERLERIDYEFRERISKLPNNNLSIKEFPETADDKDKDILDKLVKARFIECRLSSNGKYDMTERRLSKKIARFLIYQGVTDHWGGIFMNKYINLDVERSTIVNYFNVCPKDIPLKSV
jgi:ferritin-like protein